MSVYRYYKYILLNYLWHSYFHIYFHVSSDAVEIEFCSDFTFLRLFLFFIYFIYLFLTAFGLTPGGSRTVHIYTQTPGGSSIVHIYTQTVHRIQRTEHT
jgi:hypothetical protein